MIALNQLGGFSFAGSVGVWLVLAVAFNSYQEKDNIDERFGWHSGSIVRKYIQLLRH